MNSSILWRLRSASPRPLSWYVRLVTPPEGEPLELAAVKNQLRVDFDDEDDLIGGYISAARELIETECDRALLTQTWELGLDGFPYSEDRIRLPKGRLQEVLSLLYTDTSQQNTPMVAGTDYILNQYAEPAEVVLPFSRIWPPVVLSTAAPVRIQFNCGYGTTSDVPQPIKQAILMLIADWYVNREDVVIARTTAAAVQLPNAVNRLLANYRLRNYTPFNR